MAVVDWRGAESGVTTDLQGSGGTFDPKATGRVYTGTYSYRTNPTGANLGWFAIGGISSTGVPTTDSSANKGFAFVFYYDTKPSSNSEEIMVIRQGSNDRFSIRINSSGQLQFHDTSNMTSNTPLATGSTTLVAGRAYLITGKVTVGAGTATALIKVNNVTEYNGSSLNTGATNFTLVILGKRSNRNSQDVDFYYDDIVVDDTNEPSHQRIIRLPANGVSGTNQWTVVPSGSADHTQVDETPPHDSDESYVQSTGTANDTALFTFADISSAGFSGTPNVAAVRISAFVREPSAVTSANQVGGYTGAGSTLYTSTRNLPTTFDYSCYQSSFDWGRLSAWTEANANQVVGGVRETNAVAVRATLIYEEILLSTPYTQPPTDTATATDSNVKAIGKVASDSVTSDDSAVKSIGKVLDDSVTVSDNFSYVLTPGGGGGTDYTKDLDDTVSSSDSLVKSIGLVAMNVFGKFTAGGGSDFVTSADRKIASIVSVTSGGILEAINVRIRVGSGSTVGKAIIYSDSAGTPNSLLATSDEIAFSNTDFLVLRFPMSGANRIAISQTNYWIGVHVQDPGTPSVYVSKGATSNLASHNIDTYSGGAAATFGSQTLSTGPIDAWMEVSDATSSSDSAVKYSGKVLSDTATTTDLASIINSFVRTLADTIVVSDVISKRPAKPLSDSVTLSDNKTLQIGAVRAEIISTSDTFTKIVSILKQDSVSSTDSIATALAVLLSLTDSVTATDLFSYFNGVVSTQELGIIINEEDKQIIVSGESGAFVISQSANGATIVNEVL